MHVIITGASQGIGRALAKKLAYEKRIKLYLISRSGDKLSALQEECQQINSKAEIVPIVYDLSRILQEELPVEINSDHIDILINNAGLLYNKAFTEYSATEMSAITQTNFLVPAMLINKLQSKLGGTHSSHIVNIGSMGGFQGSAKFAGLSMYSATKAALASLTEALALEFSDRNISVNCLALGAVQTEMLEAAFPGYNAPLSAEEMAEFIADFALKGNRYFNGKILPVSVSTP